MGKSQLVPVAGVMVLVIIGFLLPYLSITTTGQYISTDLETSTRSLFPAAKFIREVQPEKFPSYVLTRAGVPFALNVINLGPVAQQVGGIAALLTSWSLLRDEINRWFWRAMTIGGWLLALSAVPLWVGFFLMRGAGVDLHLLPAWIPLTAAGVILVICSLKSRDRIDSYRGL